MKKLFWIDLEMTGLDVQKEVIIECAAVVSDLDLNMLEDYHAVVKQPQKYLDAMDEWNSKHHGESGLTAKVPSGKAPEVVESELLALLAKHFPGCEKKDLPVLCGNSIHQDRLFITKYWPRLDKALHYRMVDVTGWKIILEAKYGVKFKKKKAHRAVDDILESMAELKHYLGLLKLEPIAKVSH